MKRITIMWSVLLGMGLAITAGAAEVVVLTASGSALAAGTMIDGSAELSLEEGAKVTLVSQDGAVKELEGPWTGVPFPDAGEGSGDSNLLGAVTQLVKGGGESAAPGAFRGGGDPEDPPTADLIDTGRSGNYCIAGEDLPTLWRMEDEEEAELKLRHGESGARAEVFFEEEEATAMWPEEMPPEDGATYTVRWARGRVSRHITIHLTASDPPSDAASIVWMLQKGCTVQAGVLLAAVTGGEESDDHSMGGH